LCAVQVGVGAEALLPHRPGSRLFAHVLPPCLMTKDSGAYTRGGM
jgi:hypothetical protein